MLIKEHVQKIIKHIESLDFVEGINIEDDDALYLYEIEENKKEYNQFDFNEIYVEDRKEVMDDKKSKMLKSLIKSDKSLPNLNVKFDRLDAYPNGTSLYQIIVHIPY